MADTEVESILREIRERVYAEQQQSAAASTLNDESGNHFPVISNGTHAESTEALTRMEGHLTTTARAWDRLPPLVSNRSGGLARLELWIKRRLKSATRWYAWEQINFNAAVHHMLSDMLEALSALEQQLQRIRTDTEAWAQKFEQTRTEVLAHRAGIESQHAEFKRQWAEIETLRAEIETLRAQIQSLRAESESQRAESESQGRMGEAQILEVNARLAELAQELQTRDERLLDEQRVCLKQLSLEIGEANTLFDRARRQIESRLNELERNDR